jgi:hypothetical protein
MEEDIQMGKQTFDRIKKTLAILLAVFFVASMTAAAVTAAPETFDKHPNDRMGHPVVESHHAMHGHEHDNHHGHWVWVWDSGHWMWQGSHYDGHWVWVWDYGHWVWVWDNHHPGR